VRRVSIDISQLGRAIEFRCGISRPGRSRRPTQEKEKAVGEHGLGYLRRSVAGQNVNGFDIKKVKLGTS
jgi:hypothetical protein